jgi:photosystem II stability/assembly factor-like uncharacterized protein
MEKIRRVVKILALIVVLSFGTNLHAQGWIQQVSGVSTALYSTFFLDGLNGWAVGEDLTILHTTDGGLHWSGAAPQLPARYSSYGLSKVLFTTNLDGWVFGSNGLALHTTDAGSSWLPSMIGEGWDLYAAFFINEDSGWVAGDHAVIFRTTNGGAVWSQEAFDTCDWLYSMFFVDHLHGWAVGDEGTVLSTADGGDHWEVIATAVADWLADVYFVNPQKGWATGDSAAVFVTTDAGVTWTLQTRGTALTAWDIQFVDSVNGWVAGGTPPNTPMPATGLVLHTSDAGNTWVQQESGTNVCIFGIHFVTSQLGWAVGASGTIIHATTGGVTAVRRSPRQLPLEPLLYQNYPNPFNPSTLIRYELREKSVIRLVVCDILGREVATLVNQEMGAGVHTYSFDATDLPIAGGTYVYWLESEGTVEVRRMVLLR